MFLHGTIFVGRHGTIFVGGLRGVGADSTIAMVSVYLGVGVWGCLGLFVSICVCRRISSVVSVPRVCVSEREGGEGVSVPVFSAIWFMRVRVHTH